LFKNWIALWTLIIQYERTWIGDKFCKSYERFKENLPPIQIHSYLHVHVLWTAQMCCSILIFSHLYSTL
jgi:hypothetical protein